jgi:uncharacterized membrane protein YkvA (DUF1232 family)
MYANAENLASLPRILSQKSCQGPSRRRQIGAFSLSAQGLDQFNDLLARLGRPQPLDTDQIVTAARCLIDTESVDVVPACIAQRLDRAEALASLLDDQAWSPASGSAASLRAVSDYLRERNDLIPDWLPRIGRLDDAIVLETAWPLVSAEVFDYQDFCRLRRVEASLRGHEPSAFRFTRSDWEVAREAESQLQAHQRRVRESSYVPAAISYFRVH